MVRITALVLGGILLAGCSDEAAREVSSPTEQNASAEQAAEAQQRDPAAAVTPERNAYFGDLHVHTRYSYDAFVFGTRAGPDEAYEFAKGNAIKHPAGFELKLDRPLDFQGVADHANYLGMLPAMTQERP